jgi:hypothetical protein
VRAVSGRREREKTAGKRSGDADICSTLAGFRRGTQRGAHHDRSVLNHSAPRTCARAIAPLGTRTKAMRRVTIITSSTGVRCVVPGEVRSALRYAARVVTIARAHAASRPSRYVTLGRSCHVEHDCAPGFFAVSRRLRTRSLRPWIGGRCRWQFQRRWPVPSKFSDGGSMASAVG